MIQILDMDAHNEHCDASAGAEVVKCGNKTINISGSRAESGLSEYSTAGVKKSSRLGWLGFVSFKSGLTSKLYDTVSD